MVWGGWMGAHQDFVMAPAHAHLNLLGWVTLAIMGGFYALPGAKAAGRLAWANFVLSAGGVLVMIPMLVRLLASDSAHAAQIGPWMAIPEAMIFLGLGCFLINVLRSRGGGTAPT